MTGAVQTDAQADETEILFPEQHVKVGGKVLVVREFSMAEQLQYSVQARALIEALRQASFDAEEIDVLDVEAAFAKHTELLMEMISASTGEPLPWLQELRGMEASQLFNAFWAVNRDFFTQRMMAMQLNKVTGRVRPRERTSRKSSPH